MLTAQADEFGGEIPIGPFALIGGDDIGKGIVATLSAAPLAGGADAQPRRLHHRPGRPRGGQGGGDVRGRGPHRAPGPRNSGEPVPIAQADIDALYDRYQNVYGQRRRTGSDRCRRHPAPGLHHSTSTHHHPAPPAHRGRRARVHIAHPSKEITMRRSKVVRPGAPSRLLAACCSSAAWRRAATATPAAAPSDDGKLVLGLLPGRRGERLAYREHHSIKEAATAAGIELKFSDAQQKQENQIKAIRTYIQQKVDVIAFSPVVESGWDTVLKEAKDAKIPVILTDRAVDSADKSLYKTFLGSDFVKEGKAPATGWSSEKKDATGHGEHRRAAGHHRLGAGQRPQEGLRARPSPPTRTSRSSPRRPVTSPGPAASRSWSSS